MGDLTTNFSKHEFMCPCCGVLNLDPKLPILCQKIRDRLSAILGQEIAMRVNSGYRCDPHNVRVGGAKSSQHLHGRAADLADARTANRLTGTRIFEEVRKMYAEGLIPELGYAKRYNTFCHVDTRTTPVNNRFDAS